MTPSHASPLRLALGGLLCLAAAMGIGRFVLTPILPDMVAEIPLPVSVAGFIASANFLGYLLGALGATLWPRRFLAQGFVLSLVGSVVTTAAMAADDSIVTLALVRALAGVASAGVLVLSSSLVLERLARAGRGELADVHFAGVGLGIALSALLIGLLSQAGAGWRGLWEGAGLCAGALCLAAWLCLRPVLRAGGEEAAGAGGPPQEEVRPLVSAAFVRLAAAYGLFGIGYVVTATFLTSIVRASPTLAPYEVPGWMAVGLSAAVSVWVWRRIAGRMGGGPAFALACLLEAVGVAASVLVPGLAGLVLAAVLLGGTFMGITSLGLIEARRLSGADPRKVLGAMTVCFGVGQVAGPSLAGVLAQATGSFLLPSLAAAAALVGAALLVWPFGRRP